MRIGRRCDFAPGRSMPGAGDLGRRDDAAVRHGQQQRDDAQPGEQRGKVSGAEADDHERTDHRAHAIAGVGHTESMRPTERVGACEQRVECEVQCAKAEPNEQNAEQKECPGVRERRARSSQRDRGESDREYHPAVDALEAEPARQHPHRRAHEVDRECRAGARKRQVETVREALEQRSEE